jgi:hypothetical protein
MYTGFRPSLVAASSAVMRTIVSVCIRYSMESHVSVLHLCLFRTRIFLVSIAHVKMLKN